MTSKAAEYDAKLADARHEAARIIEEARQDADAYRPTSGPRPTPRSPELREQAAGRRRGVRRPRPSPTSGPRWPRWPSARPSRSSARTSTREANVALVEQLHRLRSGPKAATDGRGNRTQAYAEALLAVATPRASWPRWTTSSSRSPGHRGQRRAARRPRRPAPPGGAGASRSSRTSSGARASDVTLALVSMVVGSGSRRASCRRSSTRSVEAQRRRGRPAGGRGPLGRRPHRRPAAAPGRRARARPPASEVDVKVIIDPTVLGGLVAQVGDTVIDGSVRHRLSQLRESCPPAPDALARTRNQRKTPTWQS